MQDHPQEPRVERFRDLPPIVQGITGALIIGAVALTVLAIFSGIDHSPAEKSASITSSNPFAGPTTTLPPLAQTFVGLGSQGVAVEIVISGDGSADLFEVQLVPLDGSPPTRIPGYRLAIPLESGMPRLPASQIWLSDTTGAFFSLDTRTGELRGPAERTTRIAGSVRIRWPGAANDNEGTIETVGGEEIWSALGPWHLSADGSIVTAGNLDDAGNWTTTAVFDARTQSEIDLPEHCWTADRHYDELVLVCDSATNNGSETNGSGNNGSGNNGSAVEGSALGSVELATATFTKGVLGEPRFLAGAPETAFSWSGAITSPDGNLVLASAHDGCGGGIFLVGPTTGADAVALAISGAPGDQRRSLALGWSTDGRAILLVARDDGCGSSGDLADLVTITPGGAESPLWSPMEGGEAITLVDAQFWDTEVG